MKKLLSYALIVGVITALVGCASVPKEVVELSYRTGQDIAALHKAYDNLIHEYFDELREQRVTYIETIWVPRFINHFVTDGKLIEMAKGEIVWLETAQDFGQPSSGQAEAQLLESVQFWADEVIYQIEKKRHDLIDPLNKQEDSLRVMVSHAFSQVVQANAAITAHLNSIREVKEIQDEALGALGIFDLREKINNSLIKMSDKAKSGLEEIKRIDEQVDKAAQQIEEVQGEGN